MVAVVIEMVRRLSRGGERRIHSTHGPVGVAQKIHAILVPCGTMKFALGRGHLTVDADE